MMNKKQIKKEQLRKKEELEKNLEINDSMKSLILNGTGVIIVFILFYFITNLLVDTSPKFNVKEDDGITTIQYEEILAGEVLNKSGDYYVLFYDFLSDNKDYYDAIIEKANKKIYKVDMSKKFNKSFVSDVSNFKSLEELKVSGTTLIKIENKKIILFVEGELEKIKESL